MDLDELEKNIPSQYVDHLLSYYSTILSHEITKDGKFLLAPIKNNRLAICPIEKNLKDIHNELILNESTNSSITLISKPPTPASIIPVENSACICLFPSTNSRYNFALGGKGSIKGHKLLIENIQECEKEWVIQLSNDTTTTNSIVLTDKFIVSGCSDNNIYVHDQETHQELNKLSGHEDFIHDLKCPLNGTLVYSSSEDGSVKCWDLRSPSNPTSSFFPYKNDSIKRPNFGKWIGSIDVTSNNEWLLCGGGPSLSIWHVRSEKCAHIIDTPNVVYSTQFMSDNSNVIAAGSSNTITVWRKSDPLHPYQIESSIDTIYSISHHRYENFDYDLFSFAGDSYQIEICQNAKFIDWKFHLF